MSICYVPAYSQRFNVENEWNKSKNDPNVVKKADAIGNALKKQKIEQQQSSAENRSRTKSVEDNIATATNSAVQQAGYNKTIGTDIIKSETNDSNARQYLERKKKSAARSTKIPQKQEASGTEPNDKRLKPDISAVTYPVHSSGTSPIPSGGNYTKEFSLATKKERGLLKEFKPIEREFNNPPIFSIPNNVDIRNAKIPENSIQRNESDTPQNTEINILQQIQKTDNGININLAYKFDEIESDNNPAINDLENISAIDSVYNKTKTELQKKLNTIQTLYDITDTYDSEIALNFADARNDIMHIAVRMIDFEPINITGFIASESASQTLHELVDIDDTEFRKKYGISEKQTLNLTTDKIKDVRDYVETAVSANNIIPGVNAAYVKNVVTKNNYYKTIVNLPEAGTAIGSTIAAFQIYRDKKAVTKRREELKLQIIKLDEYLTSLEKKRSEYYNKPAAQKNNDISARHYKKKPKRYMKKN